MSGRLRIERTPDGGARVLQQTSVEIGRFMSDAHAEIFVIALDRILDAAEEAGIEEALGPSEERKGTPEPAASAACEEPAMPADDPAQAEEPASPPPTDDDLADRRDADRYDAAFARLRMGAPMKEVADQLDLPFYTLRAKWAATRKRGGILEPVRASSLPGPLATRPAPRKGSVQEALPERQPKTRPIWTEAEDTEIATASEARLPEIAQRLGRSLAEVERRREAIAQRIAKEMRDV